MTMVLPGGNDDDRLLDTNLNATEDVKFVESIKQKKPTSQTEEDDINDIYPTNSYDNVPLLQELKVTRTSSKTKMKGKVVSPSSSSTSDTMVPVTSMTAAARMRRLRGLGYIILAAFTFSLMSVCIKYATKHISSHEVVFWRMVLASGMNYILMRYYRVSIEIPATYRALVLLRCANGSVLISLSYYAISKMVLSDATVIIFTSPVITFLLGALFLGEPVERADLIGALVSYVGVVFIARPAFLFPHDGTTKENDTVAVLFAMISAVLQSFVYILMRKLNEVHYLSQSLYLCLFGAVFSVLTLWAFDVPMTIPSGFDVQVALFASAALSCIGVITLTIGFQHEKAGIGSVMRYFDVIFVFIWDSIFLGERVNGYSILGAGIIIAGAVVIALRRSQVKK